VTCQNDEAAQEAEEQGEPVGVEQLLDTGTETLSFPVDQWLDLADGATGLALVVNPSPKIRKN